MGNRFLANRPAHSGLTIAFCLLLILALTLANARQQGSHHRLSRSAANALTAALLTEVPYQGPQTFNQLGNLFNDLGTSTAPAFCVVGDTGRIVFHSTDPGRVGDDVSAVLTESGYTVGELLAHRQDQGARLAGPPEHRSDTGVAHAYWRRYEGVLLVHSSAPGSAATTWAMPLVIALSGIALGVLAARLWRRRRAIGLADATALAAQRSSAHLALGAAHDLNNMIAVVRGAAELLRAGAADRRGLLNSIDRAADHAGKLCDRLLLLRRHRKPVDETFDLSAACETFLSDWSSVLAPEVTLVWCCHAKQAGVRMDPLQLTQVLLNLAMNSRSAAGSHVRVTLSLTDAVLPAARCVGWRLRVADDGPGLQPAMLDELNDGVAPTRSGGFGLELVRTIVREAGAELQVRNNSGAEFDLFFPCVALPEGTQSDVGELNAEQVAGASEC